MSPLISHSVELEPAYGRDYKSAKAVKEAFRLKKDFLGDHTIGFKPVNIDQFEKGTRVLLRYSCKRRVTPYVV